MNANVEAMKADAIICNLRMTGRIAPKPAPLLSRKELTKSVEQRREKVLKMLKAGIYREKIAKKLGISYDVCRNDAAYLMKAGRIGHLLEQSRVPPKRVKEAAARRAKVAKLHAKGMGTGEIAAKLGASVSAVFKDVKLLIASGKSLPKHEVRLPANRESARKLYANGATITGIMAGLGLKRGTVQGYLRNWKPEDSAHDQD